MKQKNVTSGGSLPKFPDKENYKNRNQGSKKSSNDKKRKEVYNG